MAEAPVDSLNRERLCLEAQGRTVINLGQAVPDFGPPPVAVDAARRALEEPSVHVYSPDPGLPELRAAVAHSLERHFGWATARAAQTIVTGGANHAFLLICSTLLEQGDQVGLLSPFFLNHRMTVEGCGGTAVEIPPDASFSYPRETVERAIVEHGLVALVAVNPSNPTGKIFTSEELSGLLELSRKHGVWLIVDEVYRAFVPPSERMVSLGSLPAAEEGTLSFGSFSKELGMTGWRVGWLHAPESLIPHLLKVQDYSLICAPRLGQRMALASIAESPEWTASWLEELELRRRELTGRLDESGLFQRFDSRGGYFVWLRPHRGVDSAREVLEIMRRAGVLIMPGAIFGEAWSSWFRISYGNQRRAALRRAAVRLIEYFASDRYAEPMNGHREARPRAIASSTTTQGG